MQEPSSRAPLAHATLLLVVGAGRMPLVTTAPGRPGELRLMLDVAGAGYGATVSLTGPREILAKVVEDLGAALLGAER
jgi:hypothetical protein